MTEEGLALTIEKAAVNRSPFILILERQGVSSSFLLSATLSFACLTPIARWPALLCAASAAAFYLPWTWSLLARCAARHAIVRQTSPVGGFLRLTRLMNVAIFAAAFIVPVVFAHGPRVFGVSIHSGVYLLPSGKWDGGLKNRVAVSNASGAITAMGQRL